MSRQETSSRNAATSEVADRLTSDARYSYRRVRVDVAGNLDLPELVADWRAP